MTVWREVSLAGDGVTATITGDPTVGEVLTATVSDIVTSPTYQWKRDGVNIGGATNATYTVQASDIDADVTCTVSGAVAADSNVLVGIAGDGGGDEVPVEELTPGWAVGREWSWPADASDFTLTNYTQTTDAGSPVLVVNPADSFTPAKILTNATDIAHVRITAEFRAQPQSPLSITNISFQPTARYQDASNSWRAERTFADGAAWIQPIERIAASDQGGGVFDGETALDHADSATYQWIVMDVFNDVMRVKTWFQGDAEPDDWLGIPFRFRPTYGWGSSTGAGATTTEFDNIAETGAAGIRAYYGGMIKSLTVQELVPSRENLYLNAELDPSLRDTSGRPFFWSWDSKWNSETTGIIELVEDEVGPDGETLIPCLRMARSTPGSDGDGPEAIQQFYITTAAVDSYRDRPIPTVGTAFPATLNWSLWAKTTNLANATPAVGSFAEVNYYFNGSAFAENTIHGDYFTVLGANTGSQGWTKYTGTLTVHDNTNIVRLDRYIGIHDQSATGEVLIAGGDWCPRFELPS